MRIKTFIKTEDSSTRTDLILELLKFFLFYVSIDVILQQKNSKSDGKLKNFFCRIKTFWNLYFLKLLKFISLRGKNLWPLLPYNLVKYSTSVIYFMTHAYTREREITLMGYYTARRVLAEITFVTIQISELPTPSEFLFGWKWEQRLIILCLHSSTERCANSLLLFHLQF